MKKQSFEDVMISNSKMVIFRIAMLVYWRVFLHFFGCSVNFSKQKIPLDHIRDPRCSAVDWRWAPLENPGRNGKIWDDLWILGEFDHIKNDDNDTGNIYKNNNRNHVEIVVEWMKFGTYFTNLEIPRKCHVFFCCSCSNRTHEISGRSADPHGSSSSDIVKADPVSSQSLRSEKPISLGERWSHLDHQPHAWNIHQTFQGN